MSHADHAHEHHHHHGENDIVYSKVIGAHTKVASVLLKDAPELVLSHAQRQQPPHQVTLSNGQVAFMHIHETIHPGDKLIAPVNQFAIVKAAVEPVLRLTGPVASMIKAAAALGSLHEPVMASDTSLITLPTDTALAIAKALGLASEHIDAAFEPVHVKVSQAHVCDHPHHHHGHDHGDHQHCGHDH